MTTKRDLLRADLIAVLRRHKLSNVSERRSVMQEIDRLIYIVGVAIDLDQPAEGGK